MVLILLKRPHTFRFIIDIRCPVVITGAMRSSNEIGSDGLYNFISSIRVASSSDANDKGVMVVFNDEIHTARNVTKTHTSNINTFQSPNQGPLGILTKDNVQFYNQPYKQQSFKNNKLSVESTHDKSLWAWKVTYLILCATKRRWYGH